MKPLRVVAPAVYSLLDQAAAAVAEAARKRFILDLHCDIIERGLESPIEDLFLCAFKALAAVDGIELNLPPETADDGLPFLPDCLRIQPQVTIGRYRVDFLVTQPDSIEKTVKSVVVELAHEVLNEFRFPTKYRASDRWGTHGG